MSPRTMMRSLDRHGRDVAGNSTAVPVAMVRMNRRTWTSVHWELWWVVRLDKRFPGSTGSYYYWALHSLAASGNAPTFWQARLQSGHACRRLHFKEI